MQKRNRLGLSKKYDRPCDFESVELERGWTVEAFNRHFAVADFDAHRLGCFVARMFQKLGGVNVDAGELFTPSELVGDCDAQQSSYISDQTDKRKLLGERADGLQSSWVDS